MVTTNILLTDPLNTDGIQVGGVNTPVGFFGTAPAAQPTSPSQAAIATGASGYGNAAGAMTHYLSSQSPSSVATITVAEQSVTVTGVLATDLVYVNKPTSQAGLGLCQGRVSAANTVKLVFANNTGATLTPTGSEAYIVTTFAANLQVTATLTPAAVLANSIAEQTFTLTAPTSGPGLTLGMMVAVNKPTTQAGLGVLSCRIPANNQIAITFTNPTAATITPTAAEVYIISALTGLVPASPMINFGVNVGTLSLVATVSTNEQTITEAGVAATDVLVGMSKPSHQTGLALVNGRVSAATAIKATFANPTAANLTPTASEVYGVTVYRPSPGAPMSLFTATVTPTSVAANTSAEQTFTVTGIVSGQPVMVNPTINLTGGVNGVGIAGVRASATNTIAVTFMNNTAAAIVPPAGSWTVAQFNQTTPTAGNFVALLVAPLQYAYTALLNAMRSGMVSLGIVAGA